MPPKILAVMAKIRSANTLHFVSGFSPLWVEIDQIVLQLSPPFRRLFSVVANNRFHGFSQTIHIRLLVVRPPLRDFRGYESRITNPCSSFTSMWDSPRDPKVRQFEYVMMGMAVTNIHDYLLDSIYWAHNIFWFDVAMHQTS